jgi:hypothetical protein
MAAVVRGAHRRALWLAGQVVRARPPATDEAATIAVMDVDPERIVLPDRIRAFLIDAIGRKMSAGEGDPQPILSGLPESMIAGQVERLCDRGPFGWLLDARADRIQDRIALEVCEDSRMAGMTHYRVWDDGSVERLPSVRDAIVFPPGCSRDDEDRIREEYFVHNRAVYERLAERGFR